MKIITERDMQKLSDSRPADRLGFEWHHIRKMYDELPNAETTRLRQQLEIAVGALAHSRQCLEVANNDGLISDTLWAGDAETLFDYMDAALAQIRELEK